MMTYDARRDPEYAALFKRWREYERVAMHFTDLLIRLRSQALAAIGGFAAIAGVLLKSADILERVRWEAMAVVFGTLAILWLAIGVLDFAYYSRLLKGAVRALLDLERTSAGKLQLSTSIEKAVRPHGGADKTAGWPWGIWVFYILVLVVLAAATAAAWHLATHSPELSQALPKNVVRPAR